MFACKVCGEPLEVQVIKNSWTQFPVSKGNGVIDWNTNLMEDQPGSEIISSKVCCSDDVDHECGFVYNDETNTIEEKK